MNTCMFQESLDDYFQLPQEQSYGFITMDNLDEKIQEAVDYEVDYNFALSTDGQKITS